MEVTFYGVRGSIAVPGPATIRYGGNTACVEVRTAAGARIVLDAGTGLRALGRTMAEESPPSRETWLFLSHTHLDHVIGLPFFGPAYAPGHRLHVHGPRWPGRSLREVLEGAQARELFPVPLDGLGAVTTFRELGPGERVEIARGIAVEAALLNHPGAALAYRIEADGAAFVYATDTAPFEPPLLVPRELLRRGEGEGEALERLEAAALDLMRGADLVAFDTMFTPEEHARHPDWGHATPEHAASLCARAGVRRLLLFHHAPDRTDDEVDAAVARLRSLGLGIEVGAAAEGETHRLPSGAGGAARR